jgi:hypothetical protein
MNHSDECLQSQRQLGGRETMEVLGMAGSRHNPAMELSAGGWDLLCPAALKPFNAPTHSPEPRCNTAKSQERAQPSKTRDAKIQS